MIAHSGKTCKGMLSFSRSGEQTAELFVHHFPKGRNSLIYGEPKWGLSTN
jgi:hypothetical protein